jgi:hypothetical protein
MLKVLPRGRERRLLRMKGSRWIFAFLVLALCLGSSAAWAEDECAISIDKASATTTNVIPPTGLVRHASVLYIFRTAVPLSVALETVDASHVKVTMKPTKYTPYCSVSIQWDCFPPCYFDLVGDGTSSFTLNTETGYAEK